MANNHKVAVVFTGGTISMKIDPRIAAAIPALSSEEIMSMVTNIDKFSDIEIVNFDQIPGPHMTPKRMMDLAKVVKDLVSREDITGVVITHGTDSLEETAFLLDLTINTEKPVIVVGAMRSSSELGYDGPSNLSAAICTAISEHAKNRGVLVVMNTEVNAASEVTKTHTLSLDTFKSMEFGPLGIVDNDEVIFYRDMTKHHHIETNTIEPNVDLIKCAVGMDSRLIKFCVDSGTKGLVLEAMGRGNVPPMMMEGIEYAVQKGVIIVMVSRCPMGRVLDTYGYEGAGRALRNLGVIFGGNFPGQKARIKLMLALSVTRDQKIIKEIFECGLYNK
ncbi:asparaginase [Geosporobacter subterraneus DSM 17957]|uniref:asparaginase n=1 Tax=Geosporobacter subterraneus DSM 17957 TaxID=1121919 RepID=A0A1M6IBU0_9FIRM|nr:asparaginase [Geosporobacter subterraneus]SHJ31865.1 asparaginase [Geosporobacter subterraneus DSM 17957]